MECGAEGPTPLTGLVSPNCPNLHYPNQKKPLLKVPKRHIYSLRAQTVHNKITGLVNTSDSHILWPGGEISDFQNFTLHSQAVKKQDYDTLSPHIFRPLSAVLKTLIFWSPAKVADYLMSHEASRSLNSAWGHRDYFSCFIILHQDTLYKMPVMSAHMVRGVCEQAQKHKEVQSYFF